MPITKGDVNKAILETGLVQRMVAEAYRYPQKDYDRLFETDNSREATILEIDIWKL